MTCQPHDHNLPATSLYPYPFPATVHEPLSIVSLSLATTHFQPHPAHPNPYTLATPFQPHSATHTQPYTPHRSHRISNTISTTPYHSPSPHEPHAIPATFRTSHTRITHTPPGLTSPHPHLYWPLQTLYITKAKPLLGCG